MPTVIKNLMQAKRKKMPQSGIDEEGEYVDGHHTTSLSLQLWKN